MKKLLECGDLIFRKFLLNTIISVGEHAKIALRISLALFEFENALNIELLQELKEKNSTPFLVYDLVII